MGTERVDLTVLEQRVHTLADEREELLGRRQRLALEARQDAAVAEELEHVKARIGVIESEQEDLVLARKELEARAVAEETRRREMERAREEAQLAECWRQRLPIAAEIEAATEALASAVSRAHFLGDETVRLTHKLTGRLNSRLDMRDAVIGYLKWQLPELGLGRAQPFYRRPLRAVLASMVAPSGQEPAADQRPAGPSEEASP